MGDGVRVGLRTQCVRQLQQKRLPLLRHASLRQTILSRLPSRHIKVGQELVDRPPALVLESAQEHRGEEPRPVLSVLNGFDVGVSGMRQRFAERDRVLRVGAGAVQEVRLLAKHLVHRIAGQPQEGVVGEHDGVAGQARGGDRHGHARGAHRLHEHPAFQPQAFDAALGGRALRRARLVGLEGVVRGRVAVVVH